MLKLMTIMATAVATIPGVANASAPGEFEKMYARANRACVAMSGLARPQLLAKTISFSDVIGVEIRQLRGLDNRGRMKRLLCAYNRSTGKTEVQDADVWNGPTTTP